MSAILNLAAYRFCPLDDLPRRRREILAASLRRGLRGTVLLSPEGINLFVAGPEDHVRSWWDWLVAHSAFEGLEAKESWSDDQPFTRMLVRLKQEIIAFGVPEIDPGRRTSPKLSADDLRTWLDEGREVTLLDVRNDYEVEVGTFRGAQPIGVGHFRDFPAAVDRLPEDWKSRPLVMFCTGGIRCEKAGPLMESKGFREVYQLDSGILKYLERHGSAHYDGDCFVFDKRVALDGRLRPSGLAQCYACQAVLSPEDQQSPHYRPPHACPRCCQEPEAAMRERIAERHEALRRVTAVLPGSIPQDNVRPIHVPLRFDGATILECLCGMHPHLGEDYWQQEFDAGRIVRGQVPVGAGRRIKAGQRLGHLFPNATEPHVNAAIEILWEDDAIVVVNKPAPLPMHPSGRFNRNTLSSLLAQVYSPQILRSVHRLDANTTGLAVLAKSKAFATQLQQQFAGGTVAKTYLAECRGTPTQQRFVCDLAISRRRIAGGARITDAAGDPARTEFEVLDRSSGTREEPTALIQAVPKTGRTNQIRLHLWSLDLPIVGDPIYRPGGELGDRQTRSLQCEPMRLHAWKLSFTHPQSGEAVSFEAPPPPWAGDFPSQTRS